MKRLGLIAAAAATVFLVTLDQDVGAAPATSNSPETYKQLNLFGDVFELVRSNYVDDVTDDDVRTLQNRPRPQPFQGEQCFVEPGFRHGGTHHPTEEPPPARPHGVVPVPAARVTGRFPLGSGDVTGAAGK